MKFSDAYQSKYLRSVELLGRKLTVLITDVKKEKVEDPSRDLVEEKIVFHFHKEKPMIFNVTNAKRVARMIKNQDLTFAVGTLLTLYSEELTVGGSKTTGLRVQVRPPNYKEFFECAEDVDDLKERYKLLGDPKQKDLVTKISKKWQE